MTTERVSEDCSDFEVHEIRECLWPESDWCKPVVYDMVNQCRVDCRRCIDAAARGETS